MTDLRNAFAAGYECLAAWSDLLDRINVFPVADGDTGTNLRLSLAPLRGLAIGRDETIRQLSSCASGNSGNIAAAFFREFVQAGETADLPAQAGRGRDLAWRAVATPCHGTMLSVFTCLAQTLEAAEPDDFHPLVRKSLKETVLNGCRLLPDLQRAGVVDAGALGMFIFMDGFFQRLAGKLKISVPVLTMFAGKLEVSIDSEAKAGDRFCIDAVLAKGEDTVFAFEKLAELGESVVVVPDADRLKVHMHTAEPGLLRAQLGSLGEVVTWSDELIDEAETARLSNRHARRRIHIISDAAGSLPRSLARLHGISLLDSYIVADGQSSPESLCVPSRLYELMRAGYKVTTAQASTFERHQHYERACREMGRSLYLCVGSVFTGNFETAATWQKDNDPDNLLMILDTGAASGRLGLIALLTARYAEYGGNAKEVAAYARQQIADCREYVFIDELKYLVAGGRVSRAGGFFGDLLHLKPVISPTSEGVRKEGVVRNKKGQLAFALQKLEGQYVHGDRATIMLQYTDNEEWVREKVEPAVTDLLPEAELLVVPLSLTSGVHMGPGTWGVAFSPVSASGGSVVA